MPPDTFNDLPLHALSVHGTVVLVPLAALLGLLFAVPWLRRWAQIPLALVAVAAAGSAWVSVQSGHALKEAGGIGGAGLGGPVADLVERHEELATQLQWLVFGYALLAVLAVVLSRRFASSRDGADQRVDRRTDGGASRRGGLVVTALSAVLVLGAVAVGVQTYRVGDVGSQAVWNPTGSVDYGEPADE